MIEQQKNKSPEYILGHSEEELNRLVEQSSFYNDATRQAFSLAGITMGMRILDLGCGAGDLSLIAGEFVGPGGYVLGIDQSNDATLVATSRAEAANLKQVQFVVGDIHEYQTEEPFDAIVGRLVLLYQADPVRTLQRISQLVKKEGIVLFQEFDLSAAHCLPPTESFDRATGIINDTFTKARMDINLGGKLFSYFESAGLPSPQGIAFQRVFGKPDQAAINYILTTIKSLEPFAIKLGVIDRPVDFEKWSGEIRKEVLQHKSVMYTPLLVSAWSKIQ